MPVGIFIYEIDESFGPKIIADYYLDVKLTQEALKTLSDKHSRGIIDAIYKKDEHRYYSSELTHEAFEGKAYMGFILKKEEDIVSLKSLFKNIERKSAERVKSRDKKMLREFLKDTLSSIMSLLDKLKEPKIIQEKINEKTKTMIDDGKLSEARELIKLGEEIPQELAEEVREAEEYFKDKRYKKARKGYESAADLASQINEEEIVQFLNNKAEYVGNLPDLLKEQEKLMKKIEKIGTDFEQDQLRIYPRLGNLLDDLLDISNTLEDQEAIERFEGLRDLSLEASKVAKRLYKLDEKIKKILDQI